MSRLILALTAMLVMTPAHAAQRSFFDAAAFFWDGSETIGSLPGASRTTAYDFSTKGWRIYKTEDPCIVDITEPSFARPNEYVFKTTRINFRKMPEADAFTISESDDYRSFVLQAEARLPDGAICELGREIGGEFPPYTPIRDVPKGACSTSWCIWDNRGEVFLRHRLRALDYIRNTFCKGENTR